MECENVIEVMNTPLRSLMGESQITSLYGET